MIEFCFNMRRPQVEFSVFPASYCFLILSLFVFVPRFFSTSGSRKSFFNFFCLSNCHFLVPFLGFCEFFDLYWPQVNFSQFFGLSNCHFLTLITRFDLRPPEVGETPTWKSSVAVPSQVGVWSTCGRCKSEKKKNGDFSRICSSPYGVRQLGYSLFAAARLWGHHSLGAAFLGSWGNRLWKLRSPSKKEDTCQPTNIVGCFTHQYWTCLGLP